MTAQNVIDEILSLREVTEKLSPDGVNPRFILVVNERTSKQLVEHCSPHLKPKEEDEAWPSIHSFMGCEVYQRPQEASCWQFQDRDVAMSYLRGEIHEIDLLHMMVAKPT